MSVTQGPQITAKYVIVVIGANLASQTLLLVSGLGGVISSIVLSIVVSLVVSRAFSLLGGPSSQKPTPAVSMTSAMVTADAAEAVCDRCGSASDRMERVEFLAGDEANGLRRGEVTVRLCRRCFNVRAPSILACFVLFAAAIGSLAGVASLQKGEIGWGLSALAFFALAAAVSVAVLPRSSRVRKLLLERMLVNASRRIAGTVSVQALAG